MTPQAKWLRFALVGLPVGLIILGAASFWIYFEKKDREERRTFRHALALQREISETDVARYLSILGDAAKLSSDERRLTTASFIESTLGSENMGYDLKKEVHADRGVDRVSFRASLEGTRRPSDVVLVVAAYGDERADDAAAMAALCSIAHAMTGSPRVKTVRFTMLDASAGSPLPAFERLEYDMKRSGDRIVNLVALGPSARAIADEWSRKPGAAPVTMSAANSKTAADVTTEAQALRQVITDAADRL